MMQCDFQHLVIYLPFYIYLYLWYMATDFVILYVLESLIRLKLEVTSLKSVGKVIFVDIADEVYLLYLSFFKER